MPPGALASIVLLAQKESVNSLPKCTCAQSVHVAVLRFESAVVVVIEAWLPCLGVGPAKAASCLGVGTTRAQQHTTLKSAQLCAMRCTILKNFKQGFRCASSKLEFRI